ncbi:MAG TPA: preprotein translocase subunit YajC, partial [Candidatus Kapabacteria bacterium]|nr:preprotein translocase subunit YajC [Candidatus Kapabacteria bacterium]
MLELANLLMFAPPPGGQQGGAGSFLPTIIFFVFMILIMYFFMIRPQTKRQKEHQNMLAGLKKGDKVVTSAGIHGTITEIDDKTIVLQIAENTKIKIEKHAITA